MKGIKIIEKGHIEELNFNDLKQIKGALCGVYSSVCTGSGKTYSCFPKIGKGTKTCGIREESTSKLSI